ncbi:MAG TPA: hypothetical protein VJS37_08470 [Terriglobales bacterium]|nr:hypothetical protein [Terriglobales bacterium]
MAPRVNAGILIFAAFLADFLLGIFGALGMEQAYVPPDFATRHYLTFTFPYSHGLVALMGWGLLFGAVCCWMNRRDRVRVFWVIAALVFSHFILDGLVHVPELPLLGQDSPKVGLSLWNHMPLELTIESLMALAGLVIYWKGGTRVSRWGMAAFVVLLTALTWTQLVSTNPPTNSELVPTWIIAPLVFSAIPYAFDRKRIQVQVSSL